MSESAIRIDGLNQFVRSLRQIDKDLPKTLRVGFNQAAQIVVDWARPKVPSRTGRAAKSIRVQSTRTAVRVVEGSKAAPYMPWLDYGGKVGRKHSVARPFMKGGRYLYPGLSANRDKVREAVEAALIEAARSAGVEVD